MRLPLNEFRWLKQGALESHRSLESLVKRRLAHEPLQYILGNQPFGPLKILCQQPVLIPRPETENWVIRLSEYIRPTPNRPLSLLDLGTGTGCIPLLLCHLWPKGSVVATGIDISPRAISLANENATLCGISRSVFNAELSDFLDLTFPKTVNPPYNVLTSNPPYITPDEYKDLDEDVANWEDPTALIGGGDEGLQYYHAIADLISRDGFLSSDAVVALEVGHNQGDVVRDMIGSKGFKTDIWLDPWGKKRTVIGRR